MLRIENVTAEHAGTKKTREVLTKKESEVLLTAQLHAERAVNRHLRAKISSQRRQLRRLQDLYNAYLAGRKAGEALATAGESVGHYRVEKIQPCAASEIPNPVKIPLPLED